MILIQHYGKAIKGMYKKSLFDKSNKTVYEKVQFSFNCEINDLTSILELKDSYYGISIFNRIVEISQNKKYLLWQHLCQLMLFCRYTSSV